MAVYNYASFAFVKQQVANRLYDSGMVFWSAPELGLYVIEALRTWNALTSFWRSDFIFPTVAGQTWYDLTQVVNTPRPYTVTDRYLYTLMQYHLLEPATWNPWAGASTQFTADDLLEAVQRRRDELFSTTGCTLTQSLVPAVSGRILLNDLVIDVRRMAYVPSTLFPTQTASVMWPEDAWAEQSFAPLYLQNPPAGTPATYLMSTQPPISFDVDVPPAYSGFYDLLTVNAQAALSVTSASTLDIPDDWTWVLKWGALADLLSRESNARDPLRAAYCEQRYRMGLQLLGGASALLAMRVGNVALQVDAVRGADYFNTGWQGATPGPPTDALHAGLNLVATSPIADAGPYSLTATVVRNAPIPVSDSDQVQVSRDDLDAIIDYSQHLAAFKQGGAEFTATTPLLTRFLKQAALYGLKLTEIAEYTSAIYGLSQLEDGENPRMAPAPVETGGDAE